MYNTGRSLEKWRTLIEEKEGILAPPDVLISSVGTKVSLRRLRARSQCTARMRPWNGLANALQRSWEYWRTEARHST